MLVELLPWIEFFIASKKKWLWLQCGVQGRQVALREAKKKKVEAHSVG